MKNMRTWLLDRDFTKSPSGEVVGKKEVTLVRLGFNKNDVPIGIIVNEKGEFHQVLLSELEIISLSELK